MPLTEKDRIRLIEQARILRIDVLKMLANAGSGHTGGSLSAADIITTLYFYKMRHDPKNPRWEDRDFFVLSKGHAAPILYAALARCGYFAVSELDRLRKINGKLQGHPDMRMTPGVEVSTGSLGQGLSMANGLALAARLNHRNNQVYVLLGDGECQEGQIWEAAMTAAHYKIDQVTAFLDFNGLQIDGEVNKIMSIDPIDEKWRSFGWHVQEINGHDFDQIVLALEESEKIEQKPKMIIAHTVKGKGVSFMENQVKYHGIAPTAEELKLALIELGASES